MKNADKIIEREVNPDPITGEPGSHPVGTGAGAASAGLAGAGIGTAVGGPVGGVVGAVVGAVVGGLGGKGIAEAIDPTVEDAYWRKNHTTQSYASGSSYDEYQPAYRTGYEGFRRYGAQGKKYEDVESDLQRDYTSSRAAVPWEKAKYASRAAWDKVSNSHKR